MKYRVFIQEIHSVCVEVEANDESDAQSIACEMLESGDSPQTEYSETVDVNSWPVIKI